MLRVRIAEGGPTLQQHVGQRIASRLGRVPEKEIEDPPLQDITCDRNFILNTGILGILYLSALLHRVDQS